jgi:hypothetical protein
MRKDKLKNINTNRELQVVLLAFEKRWDQACSVSDPRRRHKEILRLRGEIGVFADAIKRMRQSTNSSDKDRSFLNKAFRTITGWISVVEKKYRDV